MMALRRVVAYFLILLITVLGFWFIFKKLSGQPLLDNTTQLQQLGLQEIGNEFVRIIRPTYGQKLSSPLTVRLQLRNLSEPVTINLLGSSEQLVGSQSLQPEPGSVWQDYVVQLSFVKVDDSGFVEVIYADGSPAGLRLPVKY